MIGQESKPQSRACKKTNKRNCFKKPVNCSSLLFWYFLLKPWAKVLVPACRPTSSQPQKAPLRSWWLRRRWRAADYREWGVLRKPIPEGTEAQDTFLKPKRLLGYTCWMALAPLFTWLGNSQPLAILGQPCPLPGYWEPGFHRVTGHLRFPLAGKNLIY